MRSMKAIAAMASNRVIGNHGKIPWHLPADFRWFKQNTLGQVVVMGRKTFESIGRPLPGRQTIVLSRSLPKSSAVPVAHSLEELLPLIEEDPREIWVAGGAEVYTLLLPHCSDLWITHVKQEIAGDAFFPPFENRFVRLGEVEDTPEFTIVHYQNRNRLLA
jgi:dihydrofolate reductase